MKEYLRLVLFMVWIAPLCTQAENGWYISTVDTTYYTGKYGTSIALDSLDIPHIAYCQYAGKGLMYASRNPDSTWTLEDVPIEGKIAGTDPSLKLDSFDYPHISFWQGSLGYIWKDNTGWHKEQPDGSWIECTSLTLDSKGEPHIVYSIGINNDSSLVAYTYHDSTGWHKTIIDSVGKLASGAVSIVIDKKDILHLAYPLLYPTRGIRHAVLDSGVWHIETIDSAGSPECDWHLSMAINSQDMPSMAYACSYRDTDSLYTYALKYAEKADSGWEIEKVENCGGLGGEICLQIDKNDNPHISYYGNHYLNYAWRCNNKWYIDTIEQIGNSGGQEITYTGLALDKNDFAHISYCDQLTNRGRIKYAKGCAVGISEKSRKEIAMNLDIYPVIEKRKVSILYSVKEKGRIELTIYNITGQKITTLVNGDRQSGNYKTHWEFNESIPNGLYFCSLREGNKILTKKFVILK
ncbi:MAG: T9SS type A sorting domain-containing protein [bacterium]|nr:T9SS type A sorting domain-containing protein [bacterium]